MARSGLRRKAASAANDTSDISVRIKTNEKVSGHLAIQTNNVILTNMLPIQTAKHKTFNDDDDDNYDDHEQNEESDNRHKDDSDDNNDNSNNKSDENNDRPEEVKASNDEILKLKLLHEEFLEPLTKKAKKRKKNSLHLNVTREDQNQNINETDSNNKLDVKVLKSLKEELSSNAVDDESQGNDSEDSDDEVIQFTIDKDARKSRKV